MNKTNFPIEFHAEVSTLAPKAEPEARQSLHQLGKGHQDITGAAVAIEPAAADGATYEAQVTVYMRPEILSASEKAEAPLVALKGAISAIERQVRQERAKRGEVWKRPDLSDQDPMTP